MGETSVQKASDGSVCKLWHHFTQSVQFHKPEKSGKISVPEQWQARFNLNFEEMFFDILVI